MEGKKLCHSEVKILKTRGSPKKRLEEGRRIVSDLIKDYRVQVLVIEKPFFFWSKQSNLLNILVEEIKFLAKKKKIKVYEFSPRTVRKSVCGNGNATKKDMAKFLASIYPELRIRLNQNRRYKEIYWGHMFDAVGLGVCYLKRERNTKCRSYHLRFA